MLMLNCLFMYLLLNYFKFTTFYVKTFSSYHHHHLIAVRVKCILKCIIYNVILNFCLIYSIVPFSFVCQLKIVCQSEVLQYFYYMFFELLLKILILYSISSIIKQWTLEHYFLSSNLNFLTVINQQVHTSSSCLYELSHSWCKFIK